MEVFSSKTIPKNLDPSNKMDLDFWSWKMDLDFLDCFGTEKLSKSQIRHDLCFYKICEERKLV